MAGLDESSFLDLLYGAALEPQLWPSVLERLADGLGGTSALLSRFNLVDGSGSGVVARIDPIMPALYLDHFADKNLLNNVTNPHQYVDEWRLSVLTDEDWVAKDELVKGEYYNDFLAPQQVHSTLMIRLALRGFDVCVLNINRRKDQGQFGTAERELVERLHAHLIRAYEMSERLAGAAAVSSGLESIFDASPQGLFLVDQDGRMIRINPAGERLIAAGKGILCLGGRLAAAQPDAARRLQCLIMKAASDDPEVRRGGSLALPSPSGPTPLSAIVAPIRSQSLPIFQAGRRAVVCITDLEAGMTLPAERLRALFGLTPVEARVALTLLEGASPKEAAAELGVSFHTVRVHLAHLFDKTGTRRQSELVRLLMRVAGFDPS